tara:strand:+ start:732 stop:968 length:237 start_codon:yes stop_codon:yes gene_type:complete
MSSELHKYIETAIEKKKSLLKAEVINFPNEKKMDSLKTGTQDFWQINDQSNNDQLKAVTGICFTFGSLILIGLYSNFI